MLKGSCRNFRDGGIFIDWRRLETPEFFTLYSNRCINDVRRLATIELTNTHTVNCLRNT